jgi:hypothetical protein
MLGPMKLCVELVTTSFEGDRRKLSTSSSPVSSSQGLESLGSRNPRSQLKEPTDLAIAVIQVDADIERCALQCKIKMAVNLICPKL